MNTALFRHLVFRQLDAIEHGELRMLEAGSCKAYGVTTERCDACVTVTVHDPSLYKDMVFGGSISAAEAYMDGKWSVDDLTGLIRIIAANRSVNESLERGAARLLAPLNKLAHWLRRNSQRQSRKNIRAHYDLGDDLFKLFLDPTMSYSSAVYPSQDTSLDEAAVHKLDLVCQKLQLVPEDHLLEIGTGWGGLATHAARNYGCRVTTTTISDNQYQLARERVRRAGLQDRVTVLKQDYRDLTGQYDKLVSIEMIEAVGHDFMDTYIGQCSQRLAPHGRALFQAILMDDRHYDSYRRSVDFIQKYIFPGGHLPSLNTIMSSVQSVTDFRLTGFHDITMDYAYTLRDWRERFFDKLHDVRQLGYPDEFIRMWEFYLCYCEGGFRERAISTAQIVLDKPECALPHLEVPGHHPVHISAVAA